MTFLHSIEQAALGSTYALAMGLRTIVWRVRRPMLIGVRALIVRDDSVLLIRHRSGRTPWALPGGGVERFERMEAAAWREAAEESGVTMRVEYFLGLYDRFGGGASNYIGVFVGAPLNEPRPPRSLEIAEARFFQFDQLPANTDAGTRRRVAEYRQGDHGVYRVW